MKALLYTTVLDTEHIPTYEALSYTWGSQADPASIDVKTATETEVEALLSEHDESPKEAVPGIRVSELEVQAFGTLSVTQNLRTALPYLRLRDRPRAL